jgi:hypothetical protein
MSAPALTALLLCAGPLIGLEAALAAGVPPAAAAGLLAADNFLTSFAANLRLWPGAKLPAAALPTDFGFW